ncbi:LolA family protein [Aureibacter tunicatorum]|uniref:Outer membrane lipoprotein-sorting protein n=1 Tax=Aureibacter tunicatorum TaxID=866807 RepID=A0AAE4BR67_9BACT|nr:outer membrane lipoprotein carrier protein LolA [Aureibacter tunicatorum]MDR6238346.1 outer membrane lipoprotein-sorting protein [Aureibacter tunicatorum]BDD03378.1 hypothetical protein AUTU_08610 [Aureibacter tunicatorum]
MKKYILLFVASISFLTYSFAQKDPKALAILDKMSDKYQNQEAFEAGFKQQLINQNEGLDESFEGNILVKGEKFRIDIAGQQIFNDGSAIWTYSPDDEEVTVTASEEGEDEGLNPTTFYSAYKEGFLYAVIGHESLRGKNISVIDLTPEDKSKNFFKIRMRINTTDNEILSWEIFEKGGNNYLYTIENYKPIASISDNEFQFDTEDHPDVEVVDLR